MRGQTSSGKIEHRIILEFWKPHVARQRVELVRRRRSSRLEWFVDSALKRHLLTRAGLASARARGRLGGSPPIDLDEAKVHLVLDLSRISDAAGEIDESFVTVHDRGDLLVFPPDHPRPDYALTDADEVFRQLDRRE